MAVNKTDPSCTGLGSIQLTPSGGEPTYNYKWSDDATAQDVRTNLPKGTYTVTVSDNVMCDTVITVSLENAPGTDSVKAVVLKAISCKDGADGAVIVNFEGAVPTNATYSWEKLELDRWVPLEASPACRGNLPGNSDSRWLCSHCFCTSAQPRWLIHNRC